MYALSTNVSGTVNKQRSLVDGVRATDLFRKGCDGLHMPSCYNLGVLYDLGLGVESEVHIAARYYEQACIGATPLGCVNLGMLHIPACRQATSNERELRQD